MDDEETRLLLHSLLETTFPGLDLYYRPPGNLKLNRPCVVYEPKAIEPSFSNNSTYVVGIRFQITVLSNLPGYTNIRNIFALSNTAGIVISGNRSYVSSNIVHDIFIVSVNSIT
jgi:hypothetical protein